MFPARRHFFPSTIARLDSLRFNWFELIQPIKQLSHGRCLDEKSPVFRFQESIRNGAIQPGQERIEEASGVDQADRFLVNAELGPGEDFEELVGGTETARQGDKRIGKIGHAGFAFVHGIDDVKLRKAGMGQLSVHHGPRNDADGVPARSDDGVGQHAHEADVAAPENELQTALGQKPAELLSGFAVGRITASTGAAKDAETLQHSYCR